MTEFDETTAIKFMADALGEGFGVSYDDDELLNVIDMIWDWYDDNGMTDISLDDDADVDTEALVKHVRKMLAADPGSPIAPEHVETLVLAEIAYENSIDPFA